MFNTMIAVFPEQDPEKKEQQMKSLAEEKVPAFLGFLEKRLENNTHGVLVGQDVSFCSI